MNNNPATCALINRSPGTGILFGSGTVLLNNTNLGSRQREGVDFDANYKFDLADIGAEGAGGLSFGFVGTYLMTSFENPVPGTPAFDYDCLGLFGVVCGTPQFKWRHTFRTTWSSPWDVDFSVNWRHLGSASLDVNVDNPTFNGTCGGPCGDFTDAKIKAFDYFDVSFDWTASEHITIRGGVNNVMDKDPPIVDSNNLGVSSPPFGNANTYPVVYDSLGREVFIALSTRF